MDYNQLNLVYEQIFSISLEIEKLIDEKKFTDLPQVVSKRDKLTELLADIKKESPHLKDCPSDLQELIEKLNKQELKNLERLEILKEELRKELEKTGKSSRLVSAYSQDTTESSIVNILE